MAIGRQSQSGSDTMSKLTLITGGARSGKSAYALELALKLGTEPARRFFVATAQALDAEMRTRIARHQAGRGAAFTTIEEPLEPARAIDGLAGRADCVVLDCLTLWVSNLLLKGTGDEPILEAVRGLADTLQRASFSVMVVTDEVGAGIVPDNPMGRRFRDLLGFANQALAAAADEVLLMVAGIALRLK